ncbi:MAG: N-6 DNA methylase [Planctomycetaceae bacterium]
MARNNQQFTTIRTEGALLPPDILQRIASQKVDGMRPTDYHLPEGFKTTEAITQSWDMLKKHWKSFQEAREHLSESDTGTTQTNERWLLPLFQQLGYGRLTTQPAPVIEERSYPIQRFYNKTPIHLIGCNLTLDRRTKGAQGAATASPHSMVQEYLNRSEDHLWAFLSNGRQLRLLRDNVALSRQAYVEFDLEAMMEGEVYSDFALLWMLCHQSRIEAQKTDECWLEKWSKLAREEGTRVLNDLRNGVANAIEALGRGFIAHPRNDDLRHKLQETGSLGKIDFYRQLLRIVYRLLFLFVAEDRELLHPADADENAKELYRKYYSTSRLRDMSLKLRGSKHGDLWHSLSLVFSSLGKNEGCPRLGLVGLGSFLWNTKSVADLAGPHEVAEGGIAVQIANDDLLTAVRALAYVEQDKVLRSVDYRNLGSEELGSVYESLLELHPEMHVEARQFDLRTAAGNERKTTGSYYTPDSLVQCLLDSALDPVVEDRLKGKKGEDAEAALLSMTVCDPACGSGHFLIAAAHRLARHLARVRTGDSEPSPEDHQHALRDVIGRCIYGVDINPMAVELCKVSLWMEAIEPGKPLSFLDHHIQCGNSLLGTTPRLLKEGIPDDAFKPIEGDVKSRVSDLKKQNKAERKGQSYLFGNTPFVKLGNLPAEFSRLSTAEDDTAAEIAEKERLYAELVSGAAYVNARLLADTWCAVFVWQKDTSELGKLCPTENDFRRIENNPHSILPHVKSEVRRLADQYQFFHWHLAFPDVFRLPGKREAENEQAGWNAGFDVVVGNPPWEKVKVQEREWFAASHPNIANAKTAAQRRKLIDALRADEPVTFERFTNSKRRAEATTAFFANSGKFPCGASGDMNTYPLFTETSESVISAYGRAGIIVKTGILADYSMRAFFAHFMDGARLVSAHDFSNKELIFPAVVANERFTLLTLCGSAGSPDAATISILNANVGTVADPSRRWSLSQDDVNHINPNTKTCPLFQNAQDACLVKCIYRRNPVLLHEGESGHNRWGMSYYTQLHMTNDSGLFADLEELQSQSNTVGATAVVNGDNYVSLLEGKLFDSFHHRHGDFLGIPRSKRFGIKAEPNHPSVAELTNPNHECLPRYWVLESESNRRYTEQLGFVPSGLLVFRDVCRTHTDLRTVRATICPPHAAGNKAPILIFPDADRSAHATRSLRLCGALTSFVFDYVARQKFAGGSLNKYILLQLPVIEPDSTLPLQYSNWIGQRVLELTYTAWDLEAFALDCGYVGPPFRWDGERRFLLRCELDAAYFHLYLGPPAEWGTDSPQLREMFPTPRHAVAYIMETFPIVKRKDKNQTEVRNEAGEVVKKGTYITKQTILSIYDEMQQAIDTGQAYQTRLDPPPGPPTDADGNFIPASEWDTSNWPSHIHLTRQETQP